MTEKIEIKELLTEKHTGMRVDVYGLLSRVRDSVKIEKGHRYLIGGMLKHLEELAKRYYSGDVKAVDEFLQLYCLDADRPKE